MAGAEVEGAAEAAVAAEEAEEAPWAVEVVAAVSFSKLILSIYLNIYEGNRFTNSRIDNSTSHQHLLLLLLLPLRHQVLAAVVEAAAAVAVALAEGVVEAEEVDSNQTM